MRNPSRSCSIAACLLLFCGLEAQASDRDICPRTDKKPTLYMLGSSTMGSTLGPMLKGQLKRKLGIAATRWGKASSGLARPDFHDWPGVAGGLMNRHRPDLVVVSLGTNDNQHIKLKKRGAWLHLRKQPTRWDEAYAKRVRRMLKILSGKDRKRPIIWLGPVALRGKNARRNGPRITTILQREIDAFEGRALFMDLYAPTVDEKGNPLARIPVGPEQDSRQIKARSRDGQHLSIAAVQALMIDPVLKLIADCERRREARIRGESPEDTAQQARAQTRPTVPETPDEDEVEPGAGDPGATREEVAASEQGSGG